MQTRAIIAGSLLLGLALASLAPTHDVTAQAPKPGGVLRFAVRVAGKDRRLGAGATGWAPDGSGPPADHGLDPRPAPPAGARATPRSCASFPQGPRSSRPVENDVRAGHAPYTAWPTVTPLPPGATASTTPTSHARHSAEASRPSQVV
jgi:hypothetical protein